MNNVFLAISLVFVGVLASETAPAKPQVAPPPPVATTTQPSAEAQQFEGVIVSKNGELYVLRDDANSTWYHLDDEQSAGKHLGKKVLVTGNFDGRTDVIRVQKIEEAN
jgi:uncharacterized protein YdeI (BOF family)